GMRVSGTEMGKRGRRIEITIQESRGFGVRALQGCVLAEKTLGALLFDHLSSAFGIPQEAYQAPHSGNRPGNRNKSGIRAGTGLPEQRQAGCAKCCGRAVAFQRRSSSEPGQGRTLRWIQARPYRASLSSTLIVAYRSTPSQPCDDLDVPMLDLVLLRGLPSAHLGKELHR